MPPLAFLPPVTGDTPEAERMTGIPHPREMLDLVGQETAERAFLDAYLAGTLHHAFLLTGPQGIGKATFAYRAARFLLAESEREAEPAGMFGTESPRDLSVAAHSRTAQLVAGRAHPDLGVIRRAYDAKTKKFRSEISVDDVRDTLALFEKTAAFGGWRVIIVDAADDLNANSANALLKTLEEPPRRAVFLLVAHRPETLLPTIRSRCQTLRFAPLGTPAMTQLLATFGGEGDGALIRRAEGSIRQALRLRDPATAQAIDTLDTALARLPQRDIGAIDRIAERLRGTEGQTALEDVLSAVERWLHAQMRARLADGPRHAEPFASAWAEISTRASRMQALNLDPRAFVITVFEDLAKLVSLRRA